MKKRKTSINPIEIKAGQPIQNPVAKFAGRFNKAKVFGDKSKYSRKAKHAKQEASPSVYYDELMEKPLVRFKLMNSFFRRINRDNNDGNNSKISPTFPE